MAPESQSIFLIEQIRPSTYLQFGISIIYHTGIEYSSEIGLFLIGGLIGWFMLGGLWAVILLGICFLQITIGFFYIIIVN